MAGDEGIAVELDGLEEVVDLELVVVGDGVDGVEEIGVFFLPLGFEMFFSGNGPDVVDGGFGDFGSAGDEHGAAVGLDADGGAVGAVDLDTAVECGVGGVGDEDLSDGAGFETEDGEGGIFDFDIGVVEIGPDAGEFRNPPCPCTRGGGRVDGGPG